MTANDLVLEINNTIAGYGAGKLSHKFSLWWIGQLTSEFTLAQRKREQIAAKRRAAALRVELRDKATREFKHDLREAAE